MHILIFLNTTFNFLGTHYTLTDGNFFHGLLHTVRMNYQLAIRLLMRTYDVRSVLLQRGSYYQAQLCLHFTDYFGTVAIYYHKFNVLMFLEEVWNAYALSEVRIQVILLHLCRA